MRPFLGRYIEALGALALISLAVISVSRWLSAGASLLYLVAYILAKPKSRKMGLVALSFLVFTASVLMLTA